MALAGGQRLVDDGVRRLGDDLGHLTPVPWTDGSWRPSISMAAASRINHVSVNATDLAASVEFYVDVLGAGPLATPNLGLPVQWLGLG